jgi:hypothetical protein
MRRLPAVTGRLEQAHAVQRETDHATPLARVRAPAQVRVGAARAFCRLGTYDCGIPIRLPGSSTQSFAGYRGYKCVVSAQEGFSKKVTHTLL